MSKSTIPITVVGGYLGSGKTSLINHILRHANGQRLVVLVNEFGELSIDEDLIEAQEDGIISIAGGCICCTFGDDLIGSLMDLANSEQPPDHIVIETSGVAIPSSVSSIFRVIGNFTDEGIVVIADAEQIRRQVADAYVGDTVDRQLQDADLIIINKTDLVAPSELEQVTSWIRKTYLNAPVISSTRAIVPNDIVLGIGANQQRSNSKDTSSNREALFDNSTGSTALGLEHGEINHAARLFTSVLIEPVNVDNPRHLAEFLTRPELGIIRAKGYVVCKDGTRHLLQIVGNRFDLCTAPQSSVGGVVCIGLRDSFAAEQILSLSLGKRSSNPELD